MALSTVAVGLAIIAMLLRFYCDYHLSVWFPHGGVLAGFILALVTILVFSLALPPAIHNDQNEETGGAPCYGPCQRFAGKETVASLFGLAEVTWTWGPSPGWIIGVVATVLLGILVVFLSFPRFRAAYDRID